MQYRDSSDESDQDFNSIHFDAITVTTAKPELHKSAVKDLGIQLPGHQGGDTLSLKIDTGTERNILPLQTYRRTFPNNLDAAGYPMLCKIHPEPHTALQTYNGGTVRQFGSVIIKCGSCKVLHC